MKLKKVLDENYKFTLFGIFIFLFLALFIWVNSGFQTSQNQTPLLVNLSDNDFINITHTKSNNTLYLEVAKSSIKKQLGLMNRTNILENTGMFFVFDSPRILSFWMKDTPTSLDIIFLNSTLKVTSVFKNTKPSQTSEIYSSKEDAIYVIETIGGWADKNNLAEGDSFIIE